MSILHAVHLKSMAKHCRKSYTIFVDDQTSVSPKKDIAPTVIGGYTLGNIVHDDDFKFTGGLREYIYWGGNTIKGVKIVTAVFGSPQDMCSDHTH